MPTDLVDGAVRERHQSVSPAGRVEGAFAEVLTGILQVERVSVVSHFFDDLGADSMVMAQFCARVRKRGDLPSVSMKDIYQHPTIKSLAASRPAPALTPSEAALAEVLTGVLQITTLSVDSHFFDDLGADSMVMAQFCARVRKRGDLPSVSMKDIYQHPTIKSLAAGKAEPAVIPEVTSSPADGGTLAAPETTPEPGQLFDPTTTPEPRRFADLARPAGSTQPGGPGQQVREVQPVSSVLTARPALPESRPLDRAVSAVPTTTTTAHPATSAQYVLCGVLQLLVFVAYCWLYVTIVTEGYLWVAAAGTNLGIYLRGVIFGGGAFLGLCTLPIAAKWVLVGRWKPQQFPVWSLSYFRFWLVKTLIRVNPLVFIMVGSPLYSLYLRALGARIGKGVSIFTPTVPVCTDLLTIGDGTVIRKGASLNCYRAHSGQIQTGSVTLGRDVVVSEITVLDIETAMGDGAQLGHASALHLGQSVPAGERWHGSPAVRAEVDYRSVHSADCGPLRGALFALVQLLTVVLVTLPVVVGGAAFVLAEVPQLPALLDAVDISPADGAFYVEALVASFVFMFGAMLVGLVIVGTVPRLLNLAITPDQVYPLYGLRYSAHRSVMRLTNVKLFTYLFGDSSYIVNYLRYVGYNLGRVQQTGCNFGMAVTHENPYLSSVGSGTVVADGLSINNADYSSTSFRVSLTHIGAESFLGNHIAYPSNARIGDNCLLGTKVMVPVDGKIREGVGLLGSPSFEIPRSVLRDTSLELASSDVQRRAVAAKNKHNVVTIALVLLMRWMHVFVLTMLAMLVADLYRSVGIAAVVAEFFASMVFTLAYFTLMERAGRGFRRLRPQYCSIYDLPFWQHERFWKFTLPEIDRALTGTPFKNIESRLLGVRIGKRVFDDGCAMPEKTLVTIGDDCTLNAASIIQCHSQEDGAFKSDYSTIGAGCTLGVGALVHYGVSMGDGAVLAPDSFLMKGEQVPPHAVWGGNPAGDLSDADDNQGFRRLALTTYVPRRARLTRGNGTNTSRTATPRRAMVTTGRSDS